MHVIDHTDPNVVESLVKYLKGGHFAGIFDCISEEKTSRACAAILNQLGGGVLPLTLWPPEGLPSNVNAVMGMFSMLVDLEVLSTATHTDNAPK